jgi:hypothetical protein
MRIWEFGPANLGKLHEFCEIIDFHLRSSDRKIGLVTCTDSRIFIDTVLALGAYMIMYCDKDLDETKRCLEPLLREMISYYHIVTCSTNENFELRIQDCLGGLLRRCGRRRLSGLILVSACSMRTSTSTWTARPTPICTRSCLASWS